MVKHLCEKISIAKSHILQVSVKDLSIVKLKFCKIHVCHLTPDLLTWVYRLHTIRLDLWTFTGGSIATSRLKIKYWTSLTTYEISTAIIPAKNSTIIKTPKYPKVMAESRLSQVLIRRLCQAKTCAVFIERLASISAIAARFCWSVRWAPWWHAQQTVEFPVDEAETGSRNEDEVASRGAAKEERVLLT